MLNIANAKQLTWETLAYPLAVITGIVLVLSPSAISAFVISIAGIVITCLAFIRRSVAILLFVVALGASGIKLRYGQTVILPEHLALVPVVFHAFRTRRAISRHAAIAVAAFTMWLIIAIVVSIFKSPDISQSLRLVVWMSIGIAVFAVSANSRIGDSDFIRLGCLAAALVATAACSAWAVATISQSSNTFVAADYSSSVFRAQGAMPEPNLLAAYCLVWLALALLGPPATCHFKGKSLALTILMVTICLTLTRAAIVGSVLVLLVSRINIKRSGEGIPSWVLASSVGAVVLVTIGMAFRSDSLLQMPMVGALQDRMTNVATLSSGTGRFRVQGGSLAFQDMQQQGYSGLGFNSFPQRHASNLTSDGKLYLGILWIAVLYDTGWLGFSFFLAGWMMAWASSGWRRGAPLFVSLAIVSTTTNPMWGAFPWLAFGLLASTRDQEAKSARALRGARVISIARG